MLLSHRELIQISNGLKKYLKHQKYNILDIRVLVYSLLSK